MLETIISTNFVCQNISKLKTINYILKVLQITLSVVLILWGFSLSAQEDSLGVQIGDDTLAQINKALDTLPKKGSLAYAPSGDIETTINYDAKDSIWFNVKRSTIFLYGDAHVDYGEISMDAAMMEINYAKHLVCSNAIQDSVGNYSGIPLFKDGDEVIQALEMCYNYSTKRAMISKIYMEQDEWKTQGDTVLMDKENNVYIKDGTFCPCEDIDDGTYIKSKRIKVVPGKKVVTGPFNLYVADLPTPLGFAFGYFPMPKEKSSGIIFPQYGEQPSRGFFIKDGGYYWAVNDYVGAAFTGEVYSNGGYGLASKINYKKRYRYSGNLSLKYRNVIYEQGDVFKRGDANDYELKWRHKPVSRGGKRFTSNVNIATTTYNSNNSVDAEDYFRNSMNSSITYSSKIKKTPFNYSLNFRHDQNNQNGTYNFSLPTATVSMSRVYPLKSVVKGKKSANTDFLKSIGFSYKFDFDNRLSNKYQSPSYAYPVIYEGEVVTPIDTVFLLNQEVLEEMWRNKRIGMRHKIPVSGTYKVGKALNINPSFTYTENWYTKHNNYTLDTLDGEDAVIVDTINNFSRVSSYNYSVQASSRVYGYYGIKGTRATVRHVMVPSVGYRFNPDYVERPEIYQELVTSEKDTVYIDKYQDALFRSTSSRKQSAITFQLTNALELKNIINDSIDKKYKIFDNLAVKSSYNFADTAFQLAPFVFNANTNFKRIITFQSGMTVDPYLHEYNPETDMVVRKNVFAWKRSEHGIGRLQRANISLGSKLNPKKLKGKKDDKDKESKKEEETSRSDDDYVDFNMPWNFRIRYTYYLLNDPNEGKSIDQAIQFGGDFKLTKKWRFKYSASFDLKEKKFIYPKLKILRDLGCWEMNISWVPFGPRQSYNFAINMKSNSLKALKIKKKNSWTDR